MSDPGPKVLLVHSSAEQYGADRMLLRVLDALAADIQPTVILPDDITGDMPLLRELEARSIPYEVTELPVLRRAYMSPRRIPGLLSRWWRSWRTLSKYDADVVWCATSAMLLLAPVARLQRRTVLLHVQELWTGSERIVLGVIGSAANEIVAISRSVAAALPPHLSARTQVILNGTPDPGRYGAPDSTTTPTFLVASRWNAWKGHRTLLAAWSKAGQPGKLLIAGSAPPSGQAIDVDALIQQFDIATTTDLVGEVDSIDDLILGSHYVVVPSDTPEPFGLVAVEALALGRPVIASDAGGPREIVEDGLTGYLFPAGDVEALATILRTSSASKAFVMSRDCRAAFERRFALSTFEDQLRKFWESTITTSIGSRK